jgi:hypothetical protein
MPFQSRQPSQKKDGISLDFSRIPVAAPHRGVSELEREADAIALMHIAPLSSPTAAVPGGTIAYAKQRVGTATGADLSNASVNLSPLASEPPGTLARTRDRTIEVRPDVLRPKLAIGQALLSHELTHVAQQTASEQYDGEGLEPYRDDTREISKAPSGMTQRCISCDRGCGGREASSETEETPSEPSTEESSDTTSTETSSDTETTPDEETETSTTATRVAGANPPLRDFMRIRVAWTSDDGPHAASDEMKDDESTGNGALGGIPTTWYVQRSQITGSSELERLRALQIAGDEIAIHSAHPTIDHVAWFPVACTSAPKGYETMQESLDALSEFVDELRDAGLHVSFVRLTTGLISELVCYLDHKEVSNPRSVAESIVAGESVESHGSGATEVATDYQALLERLNSLDLHLWGGANTDTVSLQSWEAQSAYPGSGLVDDVGHRDESDPNHVPRRRFQGLVDAFDPERGPGGTNRPRSLVILTHDTDARYAEEVQRDVREMESYAASRGVMIEYMTMSTLFQELVGSAP